MAKEIMFVYTNDRAVLIIRARGEKQAEEAIQDLVEDRRAWNHGGCPIRTDR